MEYGIGIMISLNKWRRPSGSEKKVGPAPETRRNSVFFHLLFLFIPPAYFFLCIHACTPMCYIIPRHPFGGLHIWRAPYMFGRTYFVWRALYSEGSTLGGLFLCFFCVSLSFLSPWLDQLSFRYQMVYLFRDHNPYSILHIPYSMLYVIYDLEDINAVNPQVRNLFHVGKNLFTVLFGSIKPPASLGNGHSSSNQ